MKFRQIFLFELACQLRNASSRIFFISTLLLPFFLIGFVEPGQRPIYLSKNALLVMTVSASLVWLLVAGAIGANTALRDVQTGMQPLIHAVPVRKIVYDGGRFLAGFLVNSIIQLAIPLGFLLVFYGYNLSADPLLPFAPAACLNAYLFVSIPLSFLVTACQFLVAVIYAKKL